MRFIALFLMAAAVVSAAEAQPTYNATSFAGLQTSGVTYLIRDLNNHGALVGHANHSNGQVDAFMISEGVLTDLGMLDTSTAKRMYAHGINDAGQITGAGLAVNFGATRNTAFVYENGVFVNLSAGTAVTSGFAINRAGVIAGSWVFGSNAQRGVLITPSPRNYVEVPTDASSLTGTLNAINDAGVAVGRSQISSTENRAILFADGVVTNLGTLGGTFSEALKINNQGWVIGRSSISGGTSANNHSFLVINGVMSDLGSLGGSGTFARDLNDLGVIVGTSRDAAGSVRSFIYSPTEGMRDLDTILGIDASTTLGYRSFTPYAINNKNQIAGIAQYFDGSSLQDQMVLFTPVATSSFSDWLNGYFSAPELNDPLLAAPSADPDQDGLSNLLEYALGSSPRSTTSTGLPELSSAGGNWLYTFQRPVNRSDLAYLVEFSTNLVTWNPVAAQKILADAETETWSASISQSAHPSGFFRLRIYR